MIEEILGTPGYPTVLENPILIVDSEVKAINKAYIFIKKNYLGVTKVGKEWREDNLIYKTTIMGYYYNNINFCNYLNDPYLSKNIKLIGNIGNYQYQLSGISINKSRFIFSKENYQIYKFKALEHKIILLSNK